MSITFWAPDAPTTKVKPFPEDEPDYEEVVSTLPELNVSQANAAGFLVLLGLVPDDCGTIEVSDMGPLIERLTVLANRPEERVALVREAPPPMQSVGWTQEGNVATLQRGLTLIEGGVSDERVRRYASTLLALLTQARQANYCVSWG